MAGEGEICKQHSMQQLDLHAGGMPLGHCTGRVGEASTDKLVAAWQLSGWLHVLCTAQLKDWLMIIVAGCVKDSRSDRDVMFFSRESLSACVAAALLRGCCGRCSSRMAG